MNNSLRAFSARPLQKFHFSLNLICYVFHLHRTFHQQLSKYVFKTNKTYAHKKDLFDDISNNVIVMSQFSLDIIFVIIYLFPNMHDMHDTMLRLHVISDRRTNVD